MHPFKCVSVCFCVSVNMYECIYLCDIKPNVIWQKQHQEMHFSNNKNKSRSKQWIIFICLCVLPSESKNLLSISSIHSIGQKPWLQSATDNLWTRTKTKKKVQFPISRLKSMAIYRKSSNKFTNREKCQTFLEKKVNKLQQNHYSNAITGNLR